MTHDEDRMRTCVRCDRIGSVAEARLTLSGGSPVTEFAPDSEHIFPEPPAWAVVGDSDVCGNCLTLAEEKHFARIYVERLRAEIRRRQDEGIPPGDHEDMLIGYAQLLQERIDRSAR